MNSDAKYHDYGLEIVGVHTPEYALNTKVKNVQAGIENLGIKYPVVQDNDYAIWRAYSNRYWPRTISLIVKVNFGLFTMAKAGTR